LKELRVDLPVISINKTPSSGCTLSGCGSGADALAHLPDSIRNKVQDHPCYSEEAHHHFARMHVAVAPACNIQCHYCNRKFDCANESRPGVVSELLTPEEAVRKVLAVAAAIPQMSVLGIAGPGDPLANPERTFETFERLSRVAPDIRLCLSTNGLALPQYIDEIARHNIDHVTLTLNCLDPEIGARIYPWIYWHHRRIRGKEAAAILIEEQQKGLEMLIERGILVKVNSVLIPGINDAHLKEVSRVIKAKGAFLHNVMPLIAEAGHGTYYGIMGQRVPLAEELEALQNECGGEMSMMRHCRQCRADAVGLLGEDRGAEFSLEKLATLPPERLDPEAAMARRKETRAAILHQLETRRNINHSQGMNTSALPGPSFRPVRMAVASAGQGLVNQHFGHAREFLIYEASPEGARFIGHRKAALYCAGDDHCGEESEARSSEKVLEHTIAALSGCEVLLCARIGFEPWSRLEAAGIVPNGEHAMEPIEAAVMAVYGEMLKAGKCSVDMDAEGQKRA
jgi:nitrogen fixation protein NifB